MDMIRFGADDIENALVHMGDDKIDDLAFGAVQLDRTGRVVAYNATEGQLTGRDPKSVIGLNFFTDVAPCTNAAGFRGRFDDGVKSGDLNALFEWTFDYRMAPTRVRVHMKKAIGADKYWIFVKRL